MFLPLLVMLSAVTHSYKPLRSNDVSVIGTHNSYKQAMSSATMVKLRSLYPAMADALDYAHRPLAEQLDVRELHPVFGHREVGRRDRMLRGWATEGWMPATTGLLFVPLLLVSVWALAQLPPLDAQDEAERAPRSPINAV